MQNRITRFQERRDSEPQPIGKILTELLARYQARFPGVRVAVEQTPAIMEDQSCLFYPAATASAS
jgi:hypothetical protein